MTSEQSARAWSESSAIRAAQHGDRDAFEFLYRLHSRRVYRVTLRILRDASDAEDLTQQVFLTLFRKIASFRGESSFSTWLHRIAVNAALMHLRRKRPVELQTESLDSDSLPTLAISDRFLRFTVDRIHLARAIRALPAGAKRLFLLHAVLGYEHHEIARLTGCSVGCSKSQVHKARKRLRKLLRRVWQTSANEPAVA